MTAETKTGRPDRWWYRKLYQARNRELRQKSSTSTNLIKRKAKTK